VLRPDVAIPHHYAFTSGWLGDRLITRSDPDPRHLAEAAAACAGHHHPAEPARCAGEHPVTDTSRYPPRVSDDLPGGPRPMIAVVDARPGHARELRAAIEELAVSVRREPGCLTFLPYQDLGMDGRFYLYEIYQDPDAFKEHLRTADVRAFFDALARHSTSAAQNLVQLTELDAP
jgi:quinol monooxygenase YgiN